MLKDSNKPSITAKYMILFIVILRIHIIIHTNITVIPTEVEPEAERSGGI